MTVDQGPLRPTRHGFLYYGSERIFVLGKGYGSCGEVTASLDDTESLISTSLLHIFTLVPVLFLSIYLFYDPLTEINRNF